MQVTRVLLIDDDSVDRLLVRRALRSTDIVLTEAASLSEGIALLDDADVDCILMDLALPEGVGLVLLNRLQSQVPHTPVVVLSTIDDEPLALAAVKAGAQDYLLMSELNRRVLVRAIRYAIERHHSDDLHRRLACTDRMAALGQIAAAVAHEINNPVTFISGNFLVLREYLSDIHCAIDELASSGIDPEWLIAWRQRFDLDQCLDEARAICNENSDGLQRIGAVVNDLTALATPVGDLVEPLDVNQVLESSLRIVSKEIHLRADLEQEFQELPPITADRGRLGEVFVNLLYNAVQSFESTGSQTNRVSVTTSVAGDDVVIEIADNGCGMPDRVRARAFDPFYTTKAPGKGTGLGLSLCSEVVRKHGGHMTLESQPGRGTTVRIRLPVQSKLQFGHQGIRIETPVPPPRVRVLVFNDTASRELAEEFDVTSTDTLEAFDVIEALEKKRFDVVVCNSDTPTGEAFRLALSKRPRLAGRVVVVGKASPLRQSKPGMAIQLSRYELLREAVVEASHQ